MRAWFPVIALIAVAPTPARAGRYDITPQQRFAWASYMICFGLGRDFRFQFFDRPLHRTGEDGKSARLVDLENAVAAGFDALSVDLFVGDRNALPGFRQLVRAVAEGELSLGLSPMFDGFGKPGVSLDDTEEKIAAWFAEFGEREGVVRYQGQPIIFTYAPYALAPDQWRDLRRRLAARGCKGFWIGEFSRYLVLGPRPDFEGAKPWMEVFDAAYSFAPMPMKRTRQILSMVRQAFPGKPWVGATRIGYWRPEIAVVLDHRGTERLRDTWRTVAATDIRWLQHTTWNDFSENHHLMPSENHDAVYSEVNRFLLEWWRSGTAKMEQPRLFLSQRQEVLVGEEAPLEAVALLPETATPARVELRLVDGENGEIRRFAAVEWREPGLQVAKFQFPVEDIPAGRLLFPRAVLQTRDGRKLLAAGRFTIVSPAGYRPERNFSWLCTDSQRVPAEIRCHWSLDGRNRGGLTQADTRGRVDFEVTAATPLAEVEMLRNGVQIYSLRREKEWHGGQRHAEGRVQLPLNRRQRLDWGPYSLRIVTADGGLWTSRPVFVRRPPEADITIGLWTFDDEEGPRILDSSPWLHDGRLGGRTLYATWRPQREPDRWGGTCLSFDGVDDRVLIDGAIVPPDRYTVECWVRLAPDNGPSRGQLIFSTAAAAVVLGVDKEKRPRVSRHADGRWWLVQGTKPLAPGSWTHLAATLDGRMLRLYVDGKLAAETPVSGAGRCGQVVMGYNSVTRGSFFHGDIDEVRVSAEALPPSRFGPHGP